MFLECINIFCNMENNRQLLYLGSECVVVVVLGIKPRALCVWGQCFTTGLRPKPTELLHMFWSFIFSWKMHFLLHCWQLVNELSLMLSTFYCFFFSVWFLSFCFDLNVSSGVCSWWESWSSSFHRKVHGVLTEYTVICSLRPPLLWVPPAIQDISCLFVLY